MAPGFTLLTDLSELTKMDADCASVIGTLMELCDRGIGLQCAGDS
jgi:hypothetical protein